MSDMYQNLISNQKYQNNSFKTGTHHEAVVTSLSPIRKESVQKMHLQILSPNLSYKSNNKSNRNSTMTDFMHKFDQKMS